MILKHQGFFMSHLKPMNRPYDFFIDYLEEAGLDVFPKKMFGSLALYRDHLILVVLSNNEKNPKDQGIWICTDFEFHEALHSELKDLRYISVFGNTSRWLLLPEDSPEFESSAFALGDLLIKKDPRIGREGKIKTKSKKPKIKNLQKKK